MHAIFADPVRLGALLVGSLILSLLLHLWARRVVTLDDPTSLQLTWFFPLLALAAKFAALILTAIDVAPLLGAEDAAERATLYAAALTHFLSWGSVLWLPAKVADAVVLLVLSALTISRRISR